MKKSVLVLLLALVCFVTSACSKSANPAAPSPVSPVGGGGSNATASIASWHILPSVACMNGIWCDLSQAIRPNAEGRYEIAFGGGTYHIQLVFRNPQEPGRVVQYRRISAFSVPEASDWNQFRQTDPGTPAEYPVKMGVNVIYPKNAPDPKIVVEATESGPGIDGVRQVGKVEIPIKLINVS